MSSFYTIFHTLKTYNPNICEHLSERFAITNPANTCNNIHQITCINPCSNKFWPKTHMFLRLNVDHFITMIIHGGDSGGRSILQTWATKWKKKKLNLLKEKLFVDHTERGCYLNWTKDVDGWIVAAMNYHISNHG